MSRVPPPRYTIVEQGRRLIVTDNWARDKVRQADPPPSRSRDLLQPPSGRSPDRTRRAGERVEYRGDARVIADMLVSLVCLGARDDAGRRIFRTQLLL